MVVNLRGGAARATSPRILYWCDTTDSQPFETGIQRVTRQLADGLVQRGVDLVPVGWDAGRRLLRLPKSDEGELAADWLLLPEIPISVLGEGLDPIQLARAYGLKSAAIVHDLIPVRSPHLYDADAQALYRRYFRMFAKADLVFATTDLVAGHLRSYLKIERLTVPPIVVVPLPGQFADTSRVQEAPTKRQSGDPLRLLTVATWEPRKNLLALLRGVRLAQNRGGSQIHLTLVGRRGCYPEHDAEIEALLATISGATARARTDNCELAELYEACHAGVYPSCDEGFGMPVLESLWLGRPCLCHAGSAMAEVAPGGGTMMTDMADDTAIAAALTRLAEEPSLIDQLTNDALARPLRTWANYAADVASRLQLAPASV